MKKWKWSCQGMKPSPHLQAAWSGQAMTCIDALAGCFAMLRSHQVRHGSTRYLIMVHVAIVSVIHASVVGMVGAR
jgi:hypothetical protein